MFWPKQTTTAWIKTPTLSFFQGKNFLFKFILGRSEPLENECFCYDEPENDMDYGICQKPLGPSGVVMIFYFP